MTRASFDHDRYFRHILLDDIGTAGQEKLRAARVLIIGAGGLGSSSSYYLAAAGIGTIGLVDPDRVERNNLQRQIIHTDSRVGQWKVDSAVQTLKELNPDITIIPYHDSIHAENADHYFSSYDLIIDAADNFTTKFLINDVCVSLKRPFIHGGVSRFSGQLFTYTPNAPCYRCLFAEPPEQEAAVNGIFNAVVGAIGTFQAAEAIKYFCDMGDLLVGRLMTIDLRTMRFRETTFPRNRNCSTCCSTAKPTENGPQRPQASSKGG